MAGGDLPAVAGIARGAPRAPGRRIWDYRVRRRGAHRQPGTCRSVRGSRAGIQKSQARGQSGAERTDGTAQGPRAGDRAVAHLHEAGTISGKMLKDLYDLAFERGQDFSAVYEKEKPQQITDSSAIEKM